LFSTYNQLAFHVPNHSITQIDSHVVLGQGTIRRELAQTPTLEEEFTFLETLRETICQLRTTEKDEPSERMAGWQQNSKGQKWTETNRNRTLLTQMYKRRHNQLWKIRK
jgi:hypothetical protein